MGERRRSVSCAYWRELRRTARGGREGERERNEEEREEQGRSRVRMMEE